MTSQERPILSLYLKLQPSLPPNPQPKHPYPRPGPVSLFVFLLSTFFHLTDSIIDLSSLTSCEVLSILLPAAPSVPSTVFVI